MSTPVDVNAILNAVMEYADMRHEACSYRAAYDALESSTGERLPVAKEMARLKHGAEDRAVALLSRIEAMLRGETGDDANATDDMIPIVWGRDHGETFPLRWPVARDQRCFCYDWRTPEATVRRADIDAWEAACAVTGRLKEKMQRECVAIPQPDEATP